MSDALNNEHEQLLMAYLDGQLGAEEQARVESLMNANPEFVRLVSQWREQGDLIRSLPKLHLDDQFADRVLAVIENRESGRSANFATDRALDSRRSENVTVTETNWRIGLAAIVSLAAMLLLTLFVFPNQDDQPSVAINTNPGEVVEKSDGTQTQPGSDSGKIEPQAGQLDANASVEPRLGPSKPSLNKTLEGNNEGPNVQPRDLVSPIRVPEQDKSIDQLLWIDMNSHATALADIEAVLLKNSISISGSSRGSQQKLDAKVMETSPSHLVQRSNSRFEALRVIATRSQVRQAINELSQKHGAKFQSIAPATGSGFFDRKQDPGTSGVLDKSGAMGDVARLSRLAGSPQGNPGLPSLPQLATVEQLQPIELVASQLNRSSGENGERAQVPDSLEMRYLDEWFGLAEKEDDSSYVRLLLLIDTSGRESDQIDQSPDSGNR